MHKKQIAAGLVLGLSTMGLSIQPSEEALAMPYFDTPEKIYSYEQPQTLFDLMQGQRQDVLELVQIQQEKLAQIEARKKHLAKLKANRLLLQNRVIQLKKYVNKTWYVFSGSTPNGWDCSGLTLWFYRDLGVELEHSATKQALYGGTIVKDPALGDLVAFKYPKSKRYHHIGIYVGDNQMIHARREGTRTELTTLSNTKFVNSEIVFIRVLEN